MLSPFPFWEILTWYQKNGRPHLPWRQFQWLSQKDICYRVWLSEILLQQTQAERVIGFFTKIIEVFPNIESLAKADYETFFPYYKGLGYYSRARNLLAAAKIVVKDFSGIFPERSEELKKLPGVGPYTAEAIRAFAYNLPTLSFDTNLEKIFSRYYFGNRAQKLTKEQKSEILQQCIHGGISGREINAALMDFASIVSLNSKRLIDFSQYSLSGCLFAKTGGNLEDDTKAKRDIFPTKDAKIVIFLQDHLGKIALSPSNSTSYIPIILPPFPDGDHRTHIKEVLLHRFNIEVSVRPAWKKEMIQDVPYIFYRTRIQVWEMSQFSQFPIKEATQELNTFLSHV